MGSSSPRHRGRRVESADRSAQQLLIHRVDLDGSSQAAQHREAQFAAEMFTEHGEPVDERRITQPLVPRR